MALAGVGRGPLSGLWVEGQTVVLQSATRLLVSTDQGASFDRERGVRHAGDCSYDGGQYALWAVCAAGMAPMPSRRVSPESTIPYCFIVATE